MNKLQELQRLHKETEIDFRINTLWDGSHEFYFNTHYRPTPNQSFTANVGIDYDKMEYFETIEEGIDFLIEKYKAL